MYICAMEKNCQFNFQLVSSTLFQLFFFPFFLLHWNVTWRFSHFFSVCSCQVLSHFDISSISFERVPTRLRPMSCCRGRKNRIFKQFFQSETQTRKRQNYWNWFPYRSWPKETAEHFPRFAFPFHLIHCAARYHCCCFLNRIMPQQRKQLRREKRV